MCGVAYLDNSSNEALSRELRASWAALSLGSASSNFLSASAFATLTLCSTAAASFCLIVAFPFSSFVILVFSFNPTRSDSTSYLALFASIFCNSSYLRSYVTSSSVLIKVALPVSNL